MTQNTYIIYLREASGADPMCVFITLAPEAMTVAEARRYIHNRYGTRLNRIVLETMTSAYEDVRARGEMYAALNDCRLYPVSATAHI